MLEYFGVAKRVCLYLARVHPRLTIDHLVAEVAAQAGEEGVTGSDVAAGSTATGERRALARREGEKGGGCKRCCWFVLSSRCWWRSCLGWSSTKYYSD